MNQFGVAVNSRRQRELAVAVAFANADELRLGGEKCLDHLRRKVSAGVFYDDRLGDAVRERVLVDALAGEGVVDVRQGDDALTSKRVYKDAFSHSIAKAI